MLAKITSKNQITIPKKIIEKIPDVKHFDVKLKDGVIIMKPIKFYDTNLDQIRAKDRREQEGSRSIDVVGAARFVSVSAD